MKRIKNFFEKFKNHFFLVIITGIIAIMMIIALPKDADSFCIGLCTGILSSFFVSVLVLIEQDRQNKKKTDALRKDLILELAEVIIRYLNLFSFHVVSAMVSVCEEETFEKWSKTYIEDIKNGKYEWLDEDIILGRAKDVCLKIEKMRENKTLMLDSGFLLKSDYKNLETIQKAFKRDYFIKMTGEKYPCKSIGTFNNEINRVLSEISDYKWLVETEFSLDNPVLDNILEEERNKNYEKY